MAPYNHRLASWGNGAYGAWQWRRRMRCRAAKWSTEGTEENLLSRMRCDTGVGEGEQETGEAADTLILFCRMPRTVSLSLDKYN